MIGYWFVAWAAALWTFRPWAHRDPRLAVLWWASVPVFGVFAVAALKSKGQANWPAPAYVSGFVLAVAWVARQATAPAGGYRLLARGFLGLAVVGGVALSLFARYPSPLRPTLSRLAGEPKAPMLPAVRKLDPTVRLAGWRTLAAAVDTVRARVAAQDGQDPLLAAPVWSIPGELGFYCAGHPQAYSFGLGICDRHSQYDLWSPNPLDDAQAFAGRTFVYVGDSFPHMAEVFDRVEPPVEVVASDGGVPVAAWRVWVCRGYRGFPARGAGAGY